MEALGIDRAAAPSDRAAPGQRHEERGEHDATQTCGSKPASAALHLVKPSKTSDQTRPPSGRTGHATT